jgi:diaminopimelate decarboxylase
MEPHDVSDTDRERDSDSCDGVAFAAIARQVGTPLYVYSARTIRERYAELDAAFGDYPHRLHYALKANSTLGIARLVKALGGRVDANSGGEIEVAQRAGFSPDDIIFTGVGKSRAELELAVELGVHAINAESRGELERVAQIAGAAGGAARVALRINPDVMAGAHPHISTGQRSHKFGVPVEQAGEICRWAAAQPGLRLVGVHVHIGSQLVTVDPVRRAASVAATVALDLAADGVAIEHIDIGGGLGISYDGSATPDPSSYASAVVEAVAPTGLSVVAEPGRWIVGPAGVLVATVVDVKPRGPDRYFVVLDAGMSELIRPALYGAFHRIDLPEPRETSPVKCDIVGPICETSDVFGVERVLPLPDVGDLVVIRDVGAYGSAMASNYNRHPLPAEAMVDDGTWRVVRRRQTVDDMLMLESG